MNDWMDYSPEDDDCTMGIKDAIRGLSLPERRIYLMWMEEGTYTEVAKSLRCSVPTVSKKVRAIKDKIRKKVDKACKGS